MTLPSSHTAGGQDHETPCWWCCGVHEHIPDHASMDFRSVSQASRVFDYLEVVISDLCHCVEARSLPQIRPPAVRSVAVRRLRGACSAADVQGGPAATAGRESPRKSRRASVEDSEIGISERERGRDRERGGGGKAFALYSAAPPTRACPEAPRVPQIQGWGTLSQEGTPQMPTTP